ARHDADRFLAGTLRSPPADLEILGWIGHLYDAATFLEQEALGLSDTGEDRGLPEEAAKLYGMMPRLLQAVLKENVEPGAYARAQRQCRVAITKLEEEAERTRKEPLAKTQPNLFEGLEDKG